MFAHDCRKETFQEKYERTLHNWADKMRLVKYPLLRVSLGEFCGTVVLIYFGAGCIAQSIFNNDAALISVSLGWGIAVLCGHLICGTMGYGHMNPAITLAFALVGKIPLITVPILSLVQISGAYFGALLVFWVYQQNIYNMDNVTNGGLLNMSTTGTIFVTRPRVGNIPGFIDQIVCTAMLAALCCAIGDKYNVRLPKYVSWFYVGLVVYALVGAYGVNAGAAINPARDFGPRLALLTLGYKDAFTCYGYYFWVPVFGPYMGAIVGTLFYELIIGIHLKGIATIEMEEGDHVERSMESTL